MTQTDDQPTIIARYAMGRILAVLAMGILMVTVVVWSSLHPQYWTYYDRKEPYQIVTEQVFGLFGAAMLIFLAAAMYGPWRTRGRGNTIRIQGDTLIYPGHEVKLAAITDVRPDSFAYWFRFRIIDVKTRDGSGGWIYAWWLKEDCDVVIARLKEALARHRDAQRP